MGGFAPLALTGLSALAGLFGSKKQTSTTNSDSTTTPEYDPQTLALKNLLTNQYSSTINTLPAWNTSYETGGLKSIVDSSANAAQAARDALAARGIARTTAGANSVADQSYQQGKNISSFLTNAPIVEDTHRDTELGGAAGFLSSLPIATHTVGNSTTEGTAGPTSPLAGFASGGAEGLAGWLGQYTAQKNLGNILKSLKNPV
jgi:hypothetical protein